MSPAAGRGRGREAAPPAAPPGGRSGYRAPGAGRGGSAPWRRELRAAEGFAARPGRGSRECEIGIPGIGDVSPGAGDPRECGIRDVSPGKRDPRECGIGDVSPGAGDPGNAGLGMGDVCPGAGAVLSGCVLHPEEQDTPNTGCFLPPARTGGRKQIVHPRETPPHDPTRQGQSCSRPWVLPQTLLTPASTETPEHTQIDAELSRHKLPVNAGQNKLHKKSPATPSHSRSRSSLGYFHCSAHRDTPRVGGSGVPRGGHD